MNENKVMALLLGECWHEATDETPCKNCGEWLWLNEPYHDSEGWMYPETVRKIMKKMPETWEKYLERMEIIHFWKDIFKHNITLKEQLSLSNFLTYLRDHKEEWAYVECNVDCFGNDDFYKPDDCMGCDGKNRQIINPEYAEVIKEMEGKG